MKHNCDELVARGKKLARYIHIQAWHQASKFVLSRLVFFPQTEKEVGRRHQGIGRPGVRKVPKSTGEQVKMEKTDCEIVCNAPTILAVKG